jgi:tetratricopeptide (TPR) repeat protein
LAAKRQIAVLKSRGKYQEAISALVTLLDTYHSDQEGWMELCDLYLEQYMYVFGNQFTHYTGCTLTNIHRYAQALFCLEEIILMQPHNSGLHLKYAEVNIIVFDS